MSKEYTNFDKLHADAAKEFEEIMGGIEARKGAAWSELVAFNFSMEQIALGVAHAITFEEAQPLIAAQAGQIAGISTAYVKLLYPERTATAAGKQEVYNELLADVELLRRKQQEYSLTESDREKD